jgi:hypothetical protein
MQNKKLKTYFHFYIIQHSNNPANNPANHITFNYKMINADTIIAHHNGLNRRDDFNNDFVSANLYNINGLVPNTDSLTIDTDIRNPFVINTFRFKFTDQFMDSLFHFSKVHQYDDRHAFKDAWTTWTDDNATLVQTEVERLTQLGYTGNVIEKMFKSARYYFRKKDVTATISAPRKQYTRISKDIIDCIDTHIKSHLVAHSLKPQDGFIDFCEKCPAEFATAARILEDAGLNAKDAHDKIKKTYKNRYSKIVVVAKM